MPYTIELEKDILERMKAQVLNSEKTRKKLHKEKRKYIYMTLIMTILLAFVLTMNVLVSKEIGTILTNIALGGTFITYCGFKIKKQNNILKDIEKNRNFIRSEQLLQTKIHEDMGTYTNTKKVTKKLIKEISKINQEPKTSETEIDKLNLNFIDKVPSDAFVELYELIEKNDQFSDVVDNAKTLSRRKK